MNVDVAVIGGGSAGLAAAVALARSRRDVVVIDAGEPRNAPAEGAHNVLGNEGISPVELLAKGRVEAESYGAQILKGRVTKASGTIDDFHLEVDGSDESVNARRVILATGLVDDIPDIPGVREGWGTSVLHCPFCHGWEVRDKRIAILSRDAVAVHQAMLFKQLSDDVSVFLNEAEAPNEEQRLQLDALGVSVVEGAIERLVVDGTQVRSVELADGSSHPIDAAVVAPRFNARTELYEQLGGEAEQTDFGLHIPADQRGMTQVPGVWAAGNSAELMTMVTGAMSAGVTAGAGVHGEMLFADLAAAVDKR